MTVEDRIRKLRIKQAITLAFVIFTTYLILWNPTSSAWFSENIAPHIGTVFAVVLQLVMSFFMMIMQFVGLMYFLAGAKCEVVLPGDAQSVTLEDDFWGLPELKKRALSMVKILQGHTNLVEMGGEPATGILLSGIPGTGKCVAGDTLVVTEAGLLPIAALHPGRQRDRAYSFGLSVATGQGGTSDTSLFYSGGYADTVRLTTARGFSIECTPEHPLMVMEPSGHAVWKRADVIGPGDHVGLARGDGLWGNSQLDVGTAYFLGIMTGDGSLRLRNGIGFSSADSELVGFFQQFCAERGWHTFPNGKYDWQCGRRDAQDWCAEMGLSRGKSHTKRVPECVLKAQGEAVIAFLQGYFDTDGGMESRNGYIELGSVSLRLLQQCQALLLNLGIVAAVGKKRGRYNGKRHVSWRLTITGRDAQLFYEYVGFRLPRKQAGAKRLPERHNTNFDVVPHVARRVRLRGTSHRREYEEAVKHPSYTTFLSRLPGEGVPADLMWVLQTQPLWDRVKTTEPGRAQVFDLTVPETHSFVANGFISHNTWLAKCMAGSAGVPFMLMEAGTLSSMWMGIGALMVRRKGAQAKKLAKRYGACVWVLDEIDSIASARGGMGMGMAGGGMMGGMGAMAKNALFAVMDGLANPPGLMGWLMRKLYGMAGLKLPTADYTVLVMGTTNRPAVLDLALLRSGRMDIKWQVNPPRTDRGLTEIITYYLGMVKHDDDFEACDLVNIFRGSTPADIKVAVRRLATSMAVREGCDKVSRHHIEMALIEALLGLEDPLDDPFEEDTHSTAYHEAAHLIAVLALYNRESELVPAFASIVPHTGTGRLGRVLGVVMPRLVRPRDSVPMHFFERGIIVSMAGREGEFLGMGNYGMGFGGDRVNIQKRLLALVMNCALGYPASLLLTPGPQGGYNLGQLPKPMQEKLTAWINSFVARTQALLRANKDAHQAMADLLLKHGTITTVQLEQFVEDHVLVIPPEVEALWAKEDVDVVD